MWQDGDRVHDTLMQVIKRGNLHWSHLNLGTLGEPHFDLPSHNSISRLHTSREEQALANSSWKSSACSPYILRKPTCQTDSFRQASFQKFNYACSYLWAG